MFLESFENSCFKNVDMLLGETTKNDLVRLHFHSLNEDYFPVSEYLQLTLIWFLLSETHGTRLFIWVIYV